MAVLRAGSLVCVPRPPLTVLRIAVTHAEASVLVAVGRLGTAVVLVVARAVDSGLVVGLGRREWELVPRGGCRKGALWSILTNVSPSTSNGRVASLDWEI